MAGRGRYKRTLPPPSVARGRDESLGMLSTLHDLCSDAERDLDPCNPEPLTPRLARAYAKIRTAHVIIDSVRKQFDEHIRWLEENGGAS
jgi:hypothetical protein